MGNLDYALITAAKNKEPYIRQTMESVVKQTQLPKATPRMNGWEVRPHPPCDATSQTGNSHPGKNAA